MKDFADQRRNMVERQIAGRGIKDSLVLDAMRSVPREAFIAEHLARHAYDDSPLPIEADQTISQPYIVALMLEAAAIEPGNRVLEIGAGSGYAAAVAGQIAREVVAIERHELLAGLASARMKQLGYDNVTIVHGDGSIGLPEKAPFDVILAAASGPCVPETLKQQLTIGGRLVMPIGGRNSIQRLVRVSRATDEKYDQDDLGAVRFVPLIGRNGFEGASLLS